MATKKKVVEEVVDQTQVFEEQQNKEQEIEAITTPSKHIEWSKILTGCIASVIGIYGIWCGIEYYKLCKIAIEAGAELPTPELAVVCVTVVLAALLGYCLYQGALKLSLNKNKLTIDKITGIVSSIEECNFLEALKKEKED